jgi:hypothetical protein
MKIFLQFATRTWSRWIHSVAQPVPPINKSRVRNWMSNTCIGSGLSRFPSGFSSMPIGQKQPLSGFLSGRTLKERTFIRHQRPRWRVEWEQIRVLSAQTTRMPPGAGCTLMKKSSSRPSGFGQDLPALPLPFSPEDDAANFSLLACNRPRGRKAAVHSCAGATPAALAGFKPAPGCRVRSLYLSPGVGRQ